MMPPRNHWRGVQILQGAPLVPDTRREHHGVARSAETPPAEGRQRAWKHWACLILSILPLSCERRPASRATSDPPSPGAPSQAAPAPPRVVFPGELRAADESVNAFVEQAMHVTTQGEYDSYRLLWSAFEKPLSRREYEEGWSAVKTVELRALEKVKVAGWPNATGGPDELTTLYLLAADVSIDPQHRMALRQPARRQVTLLILMEQGQWRLADPPPRLRAWLRERLLAKGMAPDEQADTPPKPGGAPS